MKKVLIIIFLLTLLPFIGLGDAFTLKAQNFAFENGSYWLPDVEVKANHKVACDCCRGSFDDQEAFDRHLKYNTVCADYYGINNNSDKDDDDNDDTKNDYCRFCGHPEDHCTCKYVVSNGSNNGEYGGFGGNVGSEGSDFIGGNNSGFRKHISVAELKNKWNVKLISSINLPDKLHPQTKSMECVIRAFSFMSELNGHDYATAYEVLTKIAIDKRYDLENPINGGIPLSDAITVFDSYCELAHGNYDESAIESCIDNGIAVALISLDNPPHMVTVIGYDENFYYNAAGEANGNVTIYSKNALMGSGYIYFNNIKVPYRCKHYEIY